MGPNPSRQGAQDIRLYELLTANDLAGGAMRKSARSYESPFSPATDPSNWTAKR